MPFGVIIESSHCPSHTAPVKDRLTQISIMSNRRHYRYLRKSVLHWSSVTGDSHSDVVGWGQRQSDPTLQLHACTSNPPNCSVWHAVVRPRPPGYTALPEVAGCLSWDNQARTSLTDLLSWYMNSSVCVRFYCRAHSSMLQRDLDVSVRPSVCHTLHGIDSNLINVGSCGFYSRVAHTVPTSYPTSQGNALRGFKTRKWRKTEIFDQ